jgi:hypothetical protein
LLTAITARADHTFVYTVDQPDIGYGVEARSGPYQWEWQMLLGKLKGYYPEGKPISAIDANLHDDARFTIIVQAPPGKQFLVDPPAGRRTFLDASMWFAAPPANPFSVWTAPPTSGYHFTIDGSEAGTRPYAGAAVDGSQFHLGGTFDHDITGPVTFQSLAFTADFSTDMNGQPVNFPDVPWSYSGAYGWIGFYSTKSILDPNFNPEVDRFVTVVPVPEPVSPGLLAIAAVAFVGPRRRS